MKDINYALVEDIRPPMYTAMKYWGKKPHNIWNEYIKTYTRKSGKYLDPFSGSSMSAFEAVKAGKKAYAFDINPLTSYLIDTFSTPFEEELFVKTLNQIVDKVYNSTYYKSLYEYKKKYENYVVQHVKWNENKIYEVGLLEKNSKKRLLLKPSEEDYLNINIEFDCWVPSIDYPKDMDISESLKSQTNNNISNLWTKRNLYVLSKIFYEINLLKDSAVKKHLLFGFIQTVHLSTKMCVPRSVESNRSFSTSWGRSAYMLPKRQMEMNPLLLFKGNCIGKQSVSSALKNVKNHIGKIPKAININAENDTTDFDIMYGIVDIKTIDKILPEKSIDYIMTDPPYGGLVKYLDLSFIWLIWLQQYDEKYTVQFDNEITVKNKKNIECFEKELTIGFKNLKNVLTDDGRIVFTFHNKDLKVWNAFLRSILNSGLAIEKVIHQQNKRSGESNVKDPYGTSSSDFYIRCVKSSGISTVKINCKKFEEIVVEMTESLIRKRNEPTHYQILFNSLLVDLSENHYDLSNFDIRINKVLSKYTGNKFIIIDGKWWIANKRYNKQVQSTLSNKVERFIDMILQGNKAISEKKIYEFVFKKFSNGMTPDIVFLKNIITDKLKD